jgi:hypothetical protein
MFIEVDGENTPVILGDLGGKNEKKKVISPFEFPLFFNHPTDFSKYDLNPG